MTYDSYRIAEVFDRSASSCDTVIPCFTELAALRTTAGIPMLQGAASVAADTPAG